MEEQQNRREQQLYEIISFQPLLSWRKARGCFSSLGCVEMKRFRLCEQLMLSRSLCLQIVFLCKSRTRLAWWKGHCSPVPAPENILSLNLLTPLPVTPTSVPGEHHPGPCCPGAHVADSAGMGGIFDPYSFMGWSDEPFPPHPALPGIAFH